MLKIGLAIPTLNASKEWSALLESIKIQSLPFARKLVIDSSSSDQTVIEAEQNGFETIVIERSQFSHGVTRQQCIAHLSDMEIVCFTTQDAIFAHRDTVRNLVDAFNQPGVAACYGRQLPRKEAGAIESHARIFNYREKNYVRGKEDIPKFGIKTIFFSNSFAAYRRDALVEIGGFPDVIFGEDSVAVAKLIMANYKIAYRADAQVFHSHPFSFKEEYKRYQQIGRMHAAEPWLLERFGATTEEGKRFVISELNYLLKRKPFLIPSAMLRNFLKLYGYKKGKRSLL